MTRSGFTAIGLSCRLDPADALAARLGPAAGAGQIPGMHPDRAPTIVAGVVILVEAMRAFGLDRSRYPSTTSSTAPQSRASPPMMAE